MYFSLLLDFHWYLHLLQVIKKSNFSNFLIGSKFLILSRAFFSCSFSFILFSPFFEFLIKFQEPLTSVSTQQEEKQEAWHTQDIRRIRKTV